MPKFFVDEVCGTTAQITGADARHIGLALRMRVGDSLVISAKGVDYQCQIREIVPECVTLDVINVISDTAEPSIALTLYQALPKSDKLLQIIQKSVELGAVRIVPVLTQRCVSRPTKADFDKKMPRLQKVAEAAAKQSGRSMVPEIAPLHTLEQMCEEVKQTACTLLLYEGGGKRLSELPLEQFHEVALIVGSEGGFSPEEVTRMTQAGAVPIWLGKRILRCETAPLTAISIVMYQTGNL